MRHELQKLFERHAVRDGHMRYRYIVFFVVLGGRWFWLICIDGIRSGYISSGWELRLLVDIPRRLIFLRFVPLRIHRILRNGWINEKMRAKNKNDLFFLA